MGLGGFFAILKKKKIQNAIRRIFLTPTQGKGTLLA
jgi:hypothetical protein